jgi:hypothetical protein
MKLNQRIIEEELYKFLLITIQLPEIASVTVRDVIIYKNTCNELLREKTRDMIDACYHDCLSDVDLSVEVLLNTNECITKIEYMKRIDRFGIYKSNILGMVFVEENMMYRIIFKNGIRYDFGFSFVYDDKIPLLNFDNVELEYDNTYWPMSNVNRFWFVQIQALAKLYRKDYLIADHLANMNINETLVQQMILRDIEHGTNHHRYGYKESLCYMNHSDNLLVYHDKIFDSIAQKLHGVAFAYDDLTTAFYPDYKYRSQIFFEIWNYYQLNQYEEKDSI